MRYSRPRRLAYVAPDLADGEEHLVYVMPLPDGAPMVLQGSAAVIWLAAAEGANEVSDAVAIRLGLAPDDIVADVRAYLEVLVAQGLLDRPGTSGVSV